MILLLHVPLEVPLRLRRRWLRVVKSLAGNRGASVVELAFMLPVLSLLLVGVIDLGMGYYMSIEVANAAYAGALYGTQNNTDTTGMQNAAVKDAANVKGMTATASYGCECSDGTKEVPNCTSQPSGCSLNAVDYVQVNTSATYKPLFPWPGIPSSFPLQGLARLRAGL